MQKEINIESDITNLTIVENAIDNLTNEIGINKDSYGKILIAVLEAVNNAIIHGNKSDLKKSVKVDFLIERNNLSVSVTDEGTGFKPEEVPDPTSPENIEEISGRGIFLMSKLADEIEFNRKGNNVILKFKNIMP
jgi:serine/threonine-protein kinase RsbW